MATKKTDKAEAPKGAPYAADWKVDKDQEPETVIERKRLNTGSPAAFERFKAATLAKAEKFGVIHVDPATGYRARFHPADVEA